MAAILSKGRWVKSCVTADADISLSDTLQNRLLTLCMLHLIKETSPVHIFWHFLILRWQGLLNAFLMEDQNHLNHLINTMAADDMVTWARASAAMVLT